MRQAMGNTGWSMVQSSLRTVGTGRGSGSAVETHPPAFFGSNLTAEPKASTEPDKSPASSRRIASTRWFAFGSCRS